MLLVYSRVGEQVGYHQVNNKLEYYEPLRKKNNVAAGMLKAQILDLTRLKREKKLDEYEHSDLVRPL